MAITKVKLIADSVISDVHINSLTTDALTEGEKLFYTDARVGSYLAANNFATTGAGYFYDASLSANILTFSKSDGTTDSVDLSLYLDDTNLARLVSGTLDGLTGIATFTRDDSSTFTVDFSSFLADANDYVSSGSFNTSTGILTLTRLGGGTVTVDLDGKYAEAVHTHDDRYYTELESDGRFAPISHTHLWSQITDRPTALSAFTNDLGNYGGFLTSFTETDPIYTASSWYTTTNNASNWNTAFGWGNHATAGYLTSFTETDPTVPSHVKSITATNISNWNTAYNYSQVGHLPLAGGTLTGALSVNADDGVKATYNVNGGDTWLRGWGIESNRGSVYLRPLNNNTQTLFIGYSEGSQNWNGVSVDASSFDFNGNAIIHAGNIGSQSVNYATSAGSATDSSKLPLTGGTLTGTLAMHEGAYYGTITFGSSSYWRTGISQRDATNAELRIWAKGGGAGSIYFATNFDGESSSTALPSDGMALKNNNLGIGGWGTTEFPSYKLHVKGTGYATNDFRAPIFYDSNDTGYYVDPNSFSRIERLQIGQRNDNYNVGSLAGLNPVNDWQSLTSNEGQWTVAQYNAIGSYANTPANVYTYGSVMSWRTTNHSFQLYASHTGDLAYKTQWNNDNYSGWKSPVVYGFNGGSSSGKSIYGDAFYDSDNTAHYIDPSGGSNIRNLYVGDPGDSWSDPGGWGTQVRFSNGPHVRFVLHARTPEIQAGMYVHTPSSVYIGSYTSHPVNMMVGGNSRLLIEDGRVYSHVYSEAAGSSRAPIFYDSNDTGYYIDPNGVSNLYNLRVGRVLMDYDGTDSWFRMQSGNRMRVTTTGGNDFIIPNTGEITFNGKYLRNSHYRTVSGFSDQASGGNAGWYRVAEITLTGSCTGATLYGTLYDYRYDGADAYHISIVARAECDFTSNNESHYVNIGCSILGSTNYTNYQSKIRVALVGSSTNSRTYEVQFYETPWNRDVWELQQNGGPEWTIYSTPQATRTEVGNSRAYYTSTQNADYQRANIGSYAPTFYDSNNTNYFLNPAETSEVHAIIAKGVSPYYNGEYAQFTQYGLNTCNTYSESSCVEAATIGVQNNSCSSRLKPNKYDTDYYAAAFYEYGSYATNCIDIYSSATGDGLIFTSYCGGNLCIGGTLYQNSYSDCRYKTNITTIESALDKIDAIRGVEFDWNELGKEEASREGHEVGVIAQEVESVYPIAVREVSKERTDKVVTGLVVDYEKLIPLLVQGIKELRQEINDIKQQINGGSI